MDLIVDFPRRRRSSFHPSPRVSFANHIQVNVIENLSRKYKDELWYSQLDIKLFKAQTGLLLKHISSNMTVAQYAELHADDTSAFLGLENYFSTNTPREIKYRREAICKAVLIEQHRQVVIGIHDPARIARVAVQVSELARKRAHIIGLLHVRNGII